MEHLLIFVHFTNFHQVFLREVRVFLCTLVSCSCTYLLNSYWGFYVLFLHNITFCMFVFLAWLYLINTKDLLFNYAAIPLFKLQLWSWVDYINDVHSQDLAFSYKLPVVRMITLSIVDSWGNWICLLLLTLALLWECY